MTYESVVDSFILNRQDFTAKDGRAFHLLELSYPGFQYAPGQFVMVQLQKQGFQWSYPYMIYQKTENGFQILATHTSSLFSAASGDSVAVWGANGKGCTLPESALFIAEAATLHLILPLTKACQNPHLILIGSAEMYSTDLLPEQISYMSDISAVTSCLANCKDKIYMALNMTALESILNNSNECRKKEMTIFVSTRIGCGIGACKSCYLHSPDINIGIPVCCNGPYLSLTSIDFEKDRKCFATFR